MSLLLGGLDDFIGQVCIGSRDNKILRPNDGLSGASLANRLSLSRCRRSERNPINIVKEQGPDSFLRNSPEGYLDYKSPDPFCLTRRPCRLSPKSV